jgi:hypothetical protein
MHLVVLICATYITNTNNSHADIDTVMLKRYLLTVILVYSDHPWDHKKWPLVTGGRCYEVIYVIRVQSGT